LMTRFVAEKPEVRLIRVHSLGTARVT
jgi:hypothetical protein